MSEQPGTEPVASAPQESTGRKRRRRRRRGKGGGGKAAPPGVVDAETSRMQQVVLQLISSHAHQAQSGRHRFYFETRDGRVPYLSVSEGTMKALADGKLAITESPDGQVHVIEAEGAARVAQIDTTWVRTRRR